MSAKLFSLQEFGTHFSADNSAKQTYNDNHEWHVAQTDEREDGAVVKSDTQATDKHGKSINKLANFLANALADRLKILGDLRRKRLNLLLLEELSLLLQEGTQVQGA